MARAAFLTSADLVPGRAGCREDLFELELQLAALRPACAKRDISLELCVWDAPETALRVESGAFDAVIGGTAWDYHGRAAEFLHAMDRFAAHAVVCNPPSVMRWNARKTYLRDLAQMGVRTIPTMWAERVDAETLQQAHQVLRSERVVAKPVVGACADRQVRVEQGQPPPPPSECPPSEALIQPYITSIETDGELSFLFFGGCFSHAVVKRPARGDYRIQSVYGGHESEYRPPDDEVLVAKAIVDHVPGCRTPELVYARVDLVRADDGGLMLMELELIEPYLYPEQGPNLGPRFAEALRARIDAPSLSG